MLNSSGYTARPHSEKVENHQRDADGDRRVGHVERPEVPAAPVDVDEVEHVAGAQPVDQVAGRAADDRTPARSASAAARPAGSPRRAPAPSSATAATSDRTTVLNGKVDGVQQPERRAGIVHPSQVEEAGNDLDALVQLEARPDERLVDLVERDDGAGYPELELKAPRDDHQPFTGSASASTQRSQMPAQSGSVRTVGTKRQHRSHLTPGAFSTSTRTLVGAVGRADAQVDVRDDEEHRQLRRGSVRAARQPARPP